MGRLDVVQDLLERGAEKNKPWGMFTPFSMACAEGHLEIVQFFFSKGIDIDDAPAITYERFLEQENGFGDTPLYLACYHNHMEVVRFLLSKGADTDKVLANHGKTPLHAACYLNDLELIETLLAAGADIHKGIMSGETILFTPLHDAVLGMLEIARRKRGRRRSMTEGIPLVDWEVVKFLVEKGADINYKDRAGNTPLDHLSDDPTSKRSELQDLHNFYLEVSCRPVLK